MKNFLEKHDLSPIMVKVDVFLILSSSFYNSDSQNIWLSEKGYYCSVRVLQSLRNASIPLSVNGWLNN